MPMSEDVFDSREFMLLWRSSMNKAQDMLEEQTEKLEDIFTCFKDEKNELEDEMSKAFEWCGGRDDKKKDDKTPEGSD